MDCINTLHSTCSKICQNAHKSPLLLFTSSCFPCHLPHKVSHTILLFCPLQTHTLFFCPLFSYIFPTGDMHFQIHFAPNTWCLFSLLFQRAVDSLWFQNISGDACQVIIVLLILFTVIACKYGSNHPRDWIFSTSKLRTHMLCVLPVFPWTGSSFHPDGKPSRVLHFYTQ